MEINSGRERRRGLLLNYTGNGKGKTTGGLGICLRAMGYGWKVAVIQFVKSDRDTGESYFARLHPAMDFHTIGAGFSLCNPDKDSIHHQLARHAFELACEYIAAGQVDILMLDELNVALSLGLLDTEEVMTALCNRPSWMHIIVTGRNAPTKLLSVSDLVSEITEVKHPFHNGIQAQQGIDF